MADRSAIEWTDATWNPIRARNKLTGKLGWHCEHATTGCEFCYSEGFNKRLGTGLAFKPGHRKDVEIFLDDVMLTQPLRWKKPRKIFVCSMTDAFADFVTDDMLDKMFAIMALRPDHTFQVLTKRAERMRQYFIGRKAAYGRASDFLFEIETSQNEDEIQSAADALDLADLPNGAPLPNVWLGVSTERQQEADERIPLLLQTPAAVRFVSAEPLLGPIDLTRLRGGTLNAVEGHDFEAIGDIRDAGDLSKTQHPPHLDWVIAGGESGPKARPMHPAWARSLRDKCKGANVEFHFKQHGEWIAGAQASHLTDADLAEYPVVDLQTPGPNGGQLGSYCFKVGKKAAGRLLDGIEHNGFPTARAL